VRERLEQELREARAELARLDEVVQVKGDYGMGKGDPLVVRWELNLALRAKAGRGPWFGCSLAGKREGTDERNRMCHPWWAGQPGCD
jgi:hypothetical protein